MIERTLGDVVLGFAMGAMSDKTAEAASAGSVWLNHAREGRNAVRLHQGK